MAVKVLTSDDRSAFMSILWLELFESALIKEKPAEMREYRHALQDSYDDFIERYRHCDALYRNVDEGLKNTLIYEFSKDMAKIAGCPRDSWVALICYSLVSDSIMQIKIMDILRNII